MSLDRIVEEVMAGRQLEMKEAFAEEIQKRIQEALEEKDERVLAGREKSANASAKTIASHNKVLDDHRKAHSGKEGYHHQSGPDKLAKLRDAHKSLAKIHDAHATLHKNAGNHKAADDHEEAAEGHKICHDMSRTHTRGDEKNNHDEYATHASSVGNDSSKAFKHKLPIK